MRELAIGFAIYCFVAAVVLVVRWGRREAEREAERDERHKQDLERHKQDMAALAEIREYIERTNAAIAYLRAITANPPATLEESNAVADKLRALVNAIND